MDDSSRPKEGLQADACEYEKEGRCYPLGPVRAACSAGTWSNGLADLHDLFHERTRSLLMGHESRGKFDATITQTRAR